MQEYIKTEIIKYLDVDKNNKLTNKALINYMQDIAGEHAGSLGDGLNDKERTHSAWILLNWKIKVFNRPKYQTELIVKTWVSKLERCYSWREFEIYNKNELVAIACSKWILVNSETGKITSVLKETKEKYEINSKCVFNDKTIEKIEEPQNLELRYEEIIGRTKIDTNNHLNNIYYLDYAIESLPEDVFQNKEFNNIEIMYKKQVKYKSKIKSFYKKQEENHIVVIKSEDLKYVHAIIKLY